MFESLRKKLAESQEKRHAKALDQVKEAMTKGNTKEVIRLYRKILKVEPEFAEAWANLGSALAMTGDFEKGEACLRRSHELEGDNPNTLFNLSLIVYEQDRIEEALGIMDQSIAMEPEFPMAQWAQRGNMLIELERMDEATESIEKGLAYDDTNPDIWYLLISHLQSIEALEQARAALDRALSIHGWNASIRHLNGRQLSAEGLTREAADEFDQVMRLDPENPMALLEKALVMLEEPDEEVLAQMEKELSESDSPHAKMVSALMMLKTGLLEDDEEDEEYDDDEDYDDEDECTVAFLFERWGDILTDNPEDAQVCLSMALDERPNMYAGEWFSIVEEEIVSRVNKSQFEIALKLIEETEHGKDRLSPAIIYLKQKQDPINSGPDKYTKEENEAVADLLDWIAQCNDEDS